MRLEKRDTILGVHDLNVWFGDEQVLRSLTFDVAAQRVTAFMGPANCGKSTLVRCLNRLNDFRPRFRLTGEVLFKGRDVYGKGVDTAAVRREIGMVFRHPRLFRCSIYENVAYGARVLGVSKPSTLDAIVERCLRRTGLWEAVESILQRDGVETLSIGQQQRLCIARALAVEPAVLIFDEPCGELDPIETVKIEALVRDLTKDCTVIFVTSKRRQAARVSDVAGFLYFGELIEFGTTERIFTNPRDSRTEQYVTGRLG